MSNLIEIDLLKMELKKKEELYLEALNKIDKAIQYLKPFIEYGDDITLKGKMLEPAYKILGGTNEYRK